MIYLRTRENSPMGRLMRQRLIEAGVQVCERTDGYGLQTETYDAVVSYGVGLPSGITKPVLNARAGGDKFSELQVLKTAGVPCIPFAKPEDVNTLSFPI